MNVVGKRSHSPEIAILAAPGALPLAMARLASRSEIELPPVRTIIAGTTHGSVQPRCQQWPCGLHARTVTPSTAIGSPRMCPAANDTPCVSRPEGHKE